MTITINPEPGARWNQLDFLSRAAIVMANAIELFDFLCFSFFSIYIGKAFFPPDQFSDSLLFALATFGIGFLSRPLGGIVIGNYADRVGRRPALLFSLACMATGTFTIAVTPGYEVLGWGAPALLIVARLLQGFALGGELGPSIALLLESTDSRHRGRLVSWQNASHGIAVLAAGLSGYGVTRYLNQVQLEQWGWRIPFWIGLAIVPIGLALRTRLPKILPDRSMHAAGNSIRGLLSAPGNLMIKSLLVIMCLTISMYLGNYMTTYALTTLTMSAADSLTATIVQGVSVFIGALIGGALTDRINRRSVMIVPRLVLLALIYPAFALLLQLRSVPMLTAVTAMLAVLTSISSVAVLVVVAEALPFRVRCSGIAILYATAISLFGGTTQFVVAWLINVTGDPLAPVYYIMASSVIGVVAMALLPMNGKFEWSVECRV
jgi:MFS family permease